MNYTIAYRIINLMKVTAIISDDLIEEVKKHSKGRNLTESLTIALKEWLAAKKIKDLNNMIKEAPLEFNPDLSANIIRDINRK